MKKIFLGLVLFGLIFTPILALGAPGDHNNQQDCEDAGFYWYDDKCNAESVTDQHLRTLPRDADLIGILILIANWLFTILMALAAISIVAAAFIFISSGGDSEKLNTARNWVIYALIGVLVALLAQVLVNFIDSWVE